MIAVKDIYWIAGLLEGEGWFAHRVHAGKKIGLTIHVGMTDKDVIERVKATLGFGTISQRTLPSGKIFYNWRSTHQAKTAGLMMTLLPIMGDRRKEKIIESLTEWKKHHIRMALWTHCNNGHELSGDNLVITQNGKYTKRNCKECAKLRARQYRAEERHRIIPRPRRVLL